MQVKSYAALRAGAPLEPYRFDRREPGDHDVVIDILYCGICHSDIHQARNEWRESTFPMVPGHEIAGRVSRVGSAVKRFKQGDSAGVGCFVDSCRTCANCKAGEEQFCDGPISFTYNSLEKNGKTQTMGGYSSQIVVDEKYVLRIPPTLPLERVAPLLCAGITTYSPLKYWKIGRTHKVAIVGLGGLGHMGVKFASALGAEVTVFSTSPTKATDARRLGAKYVVHSKDTEAMAAQKEKFDLILNTVSAKVPLTPYLECLKVDGTMVMVGASPDPLDLDVFDLIMRRRRLAGSLIGGIRETQEMLDFCAKNNVLADVEVIPASKINDAYERTLKSDVRYRFVIDTSTL